MAQYEALCFTGGIGSIDCVHLGWMGCPAGLRHFACGGNGKPKLSFEVVSTNSHRILASTCAHYGTRNDKTIVQFDSFVINIRTKGMYSTVVFYLYNSVGPLHEWNGSMLASTTAAKRFSKNMYFFSAIATAC